MAIARRDLLGIGAAAALAVAASSCRAGTDDPRMTTLPSATTPTGTPVSRESRIVGQPAPGALFFGASVPYQRSLEAWEEGLGPVLAVHRSYFIPDHNETEQLVARCHDDLAHGRLPHVSVKPPGTWREVGAGKHDAWLAGMLRPLAADRGPVLLTLNHEPENDAGPPGMGPSDFVAMQSRAIRLADELAPLVTVVPVMQYWSFEPRHGADPTAWIVPDAAVVGLDIYNPWSPTNQKEWRTFGSKVEEAMSWFDDGTPLVIGEYGCREDPLNPGLAAEWLRDAADYARTHDIVAMSYFNSHQNSPDGTWALEGETEEAFAELLAADWVARLA
jgi:hypothetical protein